MRSRVLATSSTGLRPAIGQELAACAPCRTALRRGAAIELHRSLATSSRQMQSRPPSSTSIPDAPEEVPYNDLYSSNYQGKSKPQGDHQRPWYRSPTTLVLGFIPIFTFGLGYWQIQRLKWKVSLIEELEDKLRKEPMRLPKNINIEALDEFAFRLVELQGQFDYSSPIFLGPRVRDGALGYQLVLPFYRAGGGDALLVNRGFIAETQMEGTGASRRLKLPPSSNESQTVRNLLALLPRIYPPNAFTPNNKPETNEWFHTNADEMARWMSARTSSPVLPIFLEEIFDGNAGEASAKIAMGQPVGRAPTIELRNQHAVYAATWFSLSAATAVMFGLLVRRGR